MLCYIQQHKVKNKERHKPETVSGMRLSMCLKDEVGACVLDLALMIMVISFCSLFMYSTGDDCWIKLRKKNPVRRALDTSATSFPWPLFLGLPSSLLNL